MKQKHKITRDQFKAADPSCYTSLKAKDYFARYMVMVYILRHSEKDKKWNDDEIRSEVDNFKPSVAMMGEIAKDIQECYQKTPGANPKAKMSASSIRRYIYYYKDGAKSGQRLKYDMIARYLGYPSWEHLHDWNAVEEHILNRYKVENAMASIQASYSLEVAKTREKTGNIESLLACDVIPGSKLCVKYGNPSKEFVLRKMNDLTDPNTGRVFTDRFMVESSPSKVVGEDHVICIPSVIVGVNLVGYDVSHHRMPILRLYKSSGIVNSIEYTI